jgi:hypothetical protein
VSDTLAILNVAWFARQSASRSLSSPPILGKSLQASNSFFSSRFSAVIFAITARIRSISEGVLAVTGSELRSLFHYDLAEDSSIDLVQPP